MQTGVSVKAGIAFLAGVVLALGGAFTYLKVSEAHVQTPVQAPVQAVAPQPEPKAIPTPVEEPPPATQVQVPKAEPAKPVTPKLILPKPKVTSRPVSLAVANPQPQLPEPVAPPPPPPVVQDTPPPAPAPVVIPTPAPVVAPAPPKPHTATIPAGTQITVRLNEKISTDHNYTGDTFRATLDAPIVIDGFIIADRGAKVLGSIVKAQKPGKFEGVAQLSLTLTEITTTDGQQMHVDTNQSLRKGPSDTGQEAAKMGGGAALGAIIGAIAGGGKGAAIGAGAGGAAGTGAVLLGHGKPAVIDNETKLTFELTNPTTLTEHLN